MRVVWTRRAIVNLHQAREYIRQDNPAAAARMGGRIEQAAVALARFPESGRAGKVEGTRELIVTGTPYLVIYRCGATMYKSCGSCTEGRNGRVPRKRNDVDGDCSNRPGTLCFSEQSGAAAPGRAGGGGGTFRVGGILLRRAPQPAHAESLPAGGAAVPGLGGNEGHRADADHAGHGRAIPRRRWAAPPPTATCTCRRCVASSTGW